MAFSSSRTGGSMAEINVTPLVDVMLVLLIIFMVTTVAVEQEKTEKQKQESIKDKTESLVELNLPVTPENPLVADPETDKLVVVVDRNLRVFVVKGVTGAGGEDPIADCSNQLKATDSAAWQGCFALVFAALDRNHRLLKKGLYLEADADTPYGFVSGVLETVRGIGVESVDIVTNPSFENVLESDTR